MPGSPVVQRDELFAEGIVPVTPLKEDSRVPCCGILVSQRPMNRLAAFHRSFGALTSGAK